MNIKHALLSILPLFIAVSVTVEARTPTFDPPLVSNDGKWLVSQGLTNCNRGVYVWSTEGGRKFKIPNGVEPRISEDSRWVSAMHDTTLIVIDLHHGTETTFESVIDYEISRFSAYLIYLEATEDNAQTGTLHAYELDGDRDMTWDRVEEFAIFQEDADAYAHLAYVVADDETGGDALEIAVIGYAKRGWGSRGSYKGESISDLSWAQDSITLAFFDTGILGSKPITWHAPAEAMEGRFTRTDSGEEL